MSKLNGLSWNDRFALIDHFNPSDKTIVSVMGVTQEELNTARGLRSSGVFSPTDNLDTASYETVFATDSSDDVTTPATTASKPGRKGGSTSTKKDSGSRGGKKPAQTATKKKAAPKKRGRKGSNIKTAFAAVPTSPTDVETFAKTHGVSIAVLRQAKRFDTEGVGKVHVKKDKASSTLMIWRENP